MAPESVDAPAQTPRPGLDPRLQYLASLEVDRTKKSVLLALITLERLRSQPIEVDIDILESLLGVRRDTLRKHLLSLRALGLLAYLRIASGAVRTQLTYQAPKVDTACNVADDVTADPAVVDSTSEPVSRATPEVHVSGARGGEAQGESQPPDTTPGDSVQSFPLASSPPPKIVVRPSNLLHIWPPLLPGVTSALTMALALMALVLLAQSLTSPPITPLTQLLGWGGLAAVALSDRAMRRHQSRFAWRTAYLGWTAVLIGAGTMLLGRL